MWGGKETEVIMQCLVIVNWILKHACKWILSSSESLRRVWSILFFFKLESISLINVGTRCLCLHVDRIFSELKVCYWSLPLLILLLVNKSWIPGERRQVTDTKTVTIPVKFIFGSKARPKKKKKFESQTQGYWDTS